jgi:3-oxoacyl-[acyl-carrier-protein] synthase III
MAEAQQRVMEMERRELEAIVKRRRPILDKVTLMEKGIKIPDLDQFMWTQTKQNYGKHVADGELEEYC